MKIYYKSMRRKIRPDGSIIYAHQRYIPEDPSIFKRADISFVGVEIALEKRGTEPGAYEIGRLFYKPTQTEARFLGVQPHTFIPFVPAA